MGWSAGLPERSPLLPPEPASAPLARAFVRERLSGAVRDPIVDTAELCVSELVTNAVLHAGTPLKVVLDWLPVPQEPEAVRLAVQDSSPVLPRRVPHTQTACTGRGLGLVATLSRAWGIDPLPGSGKAVWCELDAVAEPALPDEDALLAAWDIEVEPAAPPDATTPVVLLRRYPVALGVRQREYLEDLTRECKLAHASLVATGPPDCFVELVETLAHRYAQNLSEPDRARAAAYARGEETIDLCYEASGDFVDHIRAIRRILTELDGYSTANRLLLPGTPAEITGLLDWALLEAGAQRNGAEPTPWNGPLR
jgi:hypothetical protein